MQPIICTILGGLDHAALALEEGRVVYCNAAAAAIGCAVGDTAEQLLCDSAPLYAAYDHKAPLELAFTRLGQQISATVRPVEETDLVFLHQNPTETAVTPGALAKAVSSFRLPLSQLFVLANNLFPYLENLEDPRVQRGTSGMMRRLYQLLRETINFSTLEQLQDSGQYRFERVELGAFFSELCEKAQDYLLPLHLVVRCQTPERPVYGSIDCRQMRRAVLNLLANAAQVSPEGGCITCRVSAGNKQCCFSVKSSVNSALSPDNATGLFQRYGAEFAQPGDFGLTLVRSIAAAHGGSVMVEQQAEETLTAMSFQLQGAAEAAVRTPLLVPDYSGGFDPYLTEFSEFLPDSAYDSRNF